MKWLEERKKVNAGGRKEGSAVLTCWDDAVDACLHLLADAVLRHTGQRPVVQRTLRPVGGNGGGGVVGEGGPLSGRLTA